MVEWNAFGANVLSILCDSTFGATIICSSLKLRAQRQKSLVAGFVFMNRFLAVIQKLFI